MLGNKVTSSAIALCGLLMVPFAASAQMTALDGKWTLRPANGEWRCGIKAPPSVQITVRGGEFSWAISAAAGFGILKGTVTNSRRMRGRATLLPPSYAGDQIPLAFSATLGASGELEGQLTNESYNCSTDVTLTRETPPTTVAAQPAARPAAPAPTPSAIAPTQSLAPKPSPAPATSLAPGRNTARSDSNLLYEMEFWSTIKDSTNPQDFRAYLQQFPNGRFAQLARIRGAAAGAPRVQQPAPQPAPVQATGSDRQAPLIDVPPRVETEDALVRLVGRVQDASPVVYMSADDRPIQLASDGSFLLTRQVEVGVTKIQLAALDKWGNRAERVVEVVREPGLAALGVELGRYHALVIGNQDYQHLPKLQTAVADARAIAQVLEQNYGFDVTLLEDANRYDMMAAISRLRQQLTDRDNLLIYYAGHGVLDQEAETGFWLPVDAEAGIEVNWIANDFLTRNLKAMTAQHVMVVADSCYAGTLVREGPGAPRSGRERVEWLKRMADKRSRTALTSGGLEPVLDSGGGPQHSVFAKAFLEALRGNETVIDGTAVFAALKRPVVLNSAQTPAYSDIRRAGHDGGDFLFARR